MLSKERWERVETIYHAALQRGPEVRDAFLNEQCAGDAEIRREVDSLLSFDGRAEKFIESPAVEVAARALAAAENPTQDTGAIKEVGPYQLIERIGQGSTGDVYLALDTRLGRKVALKLLADELTGDPERISRFKQEARTTSTLSHPNIVTIFEIGEVDNRHYIATEYVEGQTLRARLNERSLSLKETLSIATQLVDALTAAHEAGIIHRDIKPENLIVRRDGLIKVLDFGIAKLTSNENLGADHLTTRTGMVLGTAAYMSPEQARGQKVDHRTDIFSAGVLLYEMLSGRKPFEGETWSDVMAAVLVKEPPRLNRAAPEVPQTVTRIVERCLEKTLDRRFQSASDLGFALRQVAIAEPTREVRVAETVRVPPVTGHRSKRSIWIGITAVIAALIGGAALLNLKQPDANSNRTTQAAKPPRLAVGGPDSSFTRLTWFDRSGKILETVGEPAEYSSPALSPDESRIVVAVKDSEVDSRDLWIISGSPNQQLRLTSESSDDMNALWTPDGQWIIYTSDKNGIRNIYRKHADGSGGEESVLNSAEELNVEDISGDGAFLIFNVRQKGAVDPALGLLALASKQRSAFARAPRRAARFSPDRRWIAYESNESGKLEIFIRAAGANGEPAAQEFLVSSSGKTATTPMWAGNGKELFYLEGHTLMVVELEVSGQKIVSGRPTPLFNVDIEDQERRNRYVVTKDGQRFLVLVKS